ncbi:hypothetical protein [Leptospira noguchii]|uniref:hypothetical protein n=1 Tax=Leptospira noguchii TaxID=28182 RepID=UPI0002BFFC62|nr:hypothetical protein [Leptospira noguchii]EMO29460.1 hypothetical protein LEP1GSC170_3954 [Leptospira interrogans serovar Bataviae str. HAI135]UOG32654.1 hypothetical protein MAL06_20525 [Leptospira noguchii]UOG36253.1 hypothetical protein MAL02_19070 [Leptospira noguchii]UOG47217.1 hypothetical protein MAL01_19475 [Leptospira noguchii]UOG50932.1 hypothetical protein MAL00_19795 [Leptospira noguchii]
MDNLYNAIIVASFSILASIITASLSYYFTKRNQNLSNERRIKEEFYRRFAKSLSDLAFDNKDREALKAFSENMNIILLIGSPSVIKALMNFHSHLQNKTQEKSE